MSQLTKRILGVFVAAAASALLVACAKGDRAGERVEVRLLTPSMLDEYVSGAESNDSTSPSAAFVASLKGDGTKSAPALFKDRVADLKSRPAGSPWLRYDDLSSPILGALVPLLAGVAVDFIVSQLDQAAESFEAQWGSAPFHDGFWLRVAAAQAPGGTNILSLDQQRVSFVGEDSAEFEIRGSRAYSVSTDELYSKPLTDKSVRVLTGPLKDKVVTIVERWQPRYVGVEIVRSTKQFPAESGGASRAILLFLPSKSDDRLFLVYPFFYGNRSAKASLGGSSQSLSATIALELAATWVGKDDRAVQATVAQAVFEVGGYDMTGPKARFWGDPAIESVGWFAAGPVGVSRAESDTAGVFRVSCSVTERDESDSRQWIERASKFIGEQRTLVVERAQEVIDAPAK